MLADAGRRRHRRGRHLAGRRRPWQAGKLPPLPGQAGRPLQLPQARAGRLRRRHSVARKQNCAYYFYVKNILGIKMSKKKSGQNLGTIRNTITMSSSRNSTNLV